MSANTPEKSSLMPATTCSAGDALLRRSDVAAPVIGFSAAAQRQPAECNYADNSPNDCLDGGL